jgi:type IV pilus assembly protein PilM
MKTEHLDFDFLGAEPAVSPNSKNGNLKRKPRFDELEEQAAMTDLLDLSLLLADKFSRQAADSPPLSSPEPSGAPFRKADRYPTNGAEPGFDINEDALKLPLDLAAETAQPENRPPTRDQEMPPAFDENTLAELNLNFSLSDPEPTPSQNSEEETQVEFQSLPAELEEPLILPPQPQTEPDAEVEPPPFIAPSEDEAALSDTDPLRGKDDEPPFTVQAAEPAHSPQAKPPHDREPETADEPLSIFTKPADSSDTDLLRGKASKFQSAKRIGIRKRRTTKIASPQSAPHSQPKSKSTPTVVSVNFSLWSLFENTRLLGLDIGTSAMKYIVLKKNARGLTLVDCGLRPLPPLPVEASEEEKRRIIGEAINRHFKLKSFKNTLATSAVSGLEVFFQNIQLPKMSRKELAKAVPWACRKDFPFPMESTVFEYQILNSKNEKQEGKYDVFVTAAQENVIAGHLEILKHAQISPAKISTLPAALYQLFKETVKSDPAKNYALIDIGGKSTHFIFIKGGQMLFAREIATGGDDFTDALTGSIFVEGQEIVINKEQAEKLKRHYGVVAVEEGLLTKEGVPVKEIMVMMGPILERLVNEIRRTVDFVNEKFGAAALEKIYLTGGGAFLKNLPARLSQELSADVQRLNPFRALLAGKFANSQELFSLGPRFATALGLALDRKTSLNLLPKKLKGAHALQHFKKMLRYLFVILTLTMAWFSQEIKFELRDIHSEFQRLHSEFNEVKPKRDKFLQLQKTLNEIRARADLYKSRIDVRLDGDSHLKAVSNLLPPNMTLTSLQMRYRSAQNEQKQEYLQEILVLEGVAFQNNSMEGITLAKFLLELERANYFYRVRLLHQKILDDGNLAFTLECEL